MLIKLNLKSETPVYMQLRNEIIKGIATKEVNPGEQLPTVRDLAKQVGLNPMTVSKAYGILKDEGIVRSEGRKGVMVREDIVANELFLSRLNNDIELLVTESVVRGFNIDNIFEIIENMKNQYSEVK